MAIRITQAGVALTVGIIVLTGLMIGGFFIVKNSGEQARREDAIKIAEQNLKDQSNNGVALNNDPDKNSNNGSSETTTSGNDATTNNEVTNDGANSTNSTNTSSSDQTVTQLPQTGPTDQLVNFVVIALLTFSSVSYITSRRRAFQTGLFPLSEVK